MQDWTNEVILAEKETFDLLAERGYDILSDYPDPSKLKRPLQEFEQQQQRHRYEFNFENYKKRIEEEYYNEDNENENSNSDEQASEYDEEDD